jgi:hypothetical protein
MPYEAIVYNVMIASPSDVNDERQAIREAIFEWNCKHSIPNGMVLIPLGWETHSAPLLGEGQEERPQAVINDMVLKHADVLIGIFKARLGSPTGRAASGTIEEINQHHSLGKPVLLYFGEQTGIVSEQDEAVQTYKEECKKKGVICEYSDCRELKEKFYGHLQLLVNRFKDKGQKPIPESRIIGIPGASLAVIEGSVSVVNEKVKILLNEILQDPKGQICMSKFIGEQVKVETNGGKYFGFEDVLRHLEQSQWIKKSDSDERIFLLTDLGHQEAAKLRSS